VSTDIWKNYFNIIEEKSREVLMVIETYEILDPETMDKAQRNYFKNNILINR
jgi:hypothetical protein